MAGIGGMTSLIAGIGRTNGGIGSAMDGRDMDGRDMDGREKGSPNHVNGTEDPMRIAASTLCVLFALLGRGMAQDGIEKESKQLEGNYRQVSGKAGGKPLPEELFRNTRLVIKGDSFVIKDDKREFLSRLSFKIDPSKNPKQMNLTSKDKTVVMCIYEISGNTLRIAKAYGDDPRPRDFDGDDCIEVWVRVKE